MQRKQEDLNLLSSLSSASFFKTGLLLSCLFSFSLNLPVFLWLHRQPDEILKPFLRSIYEEALYHSFWFI